jgi:hypothetical protein
MTQYLVAIYHPDDYDPSTEDEAMSRDIDALNKALVEEALEWGRKAAVACRTPVEVRPFN